MSTLDGISLWWPIGKGKISRLSLSLSFVSVCVSISFFCMSCLSRSLFFLCSRPFVSVSLFGIQQFMFSSFLWSFSAFATQSLKIKCSFVAATSAPPMTTETTEATTNETETSPTPEEPETTTSGNNPHVHTASELCCTNGYRMTVNTHI